jgi:hypothetical protein
VWGRHEHTPGRLDDALVFGRRAVDSVVLRVVGQDDDRGACTGCCSALHDQVRDAQTCEHEQRDERDEHDGQCD